MNRAYTFLILLGLFLPTTTTHGQHSVARQWNELLLESIRNDFARPTVHARNLFHTSIAMYDLWATFDDTSSTFFLDGEIEGFACPFDGFPTPANVDSTRNVAISYAMYRLLDHRFEDSPGADDVLPLFDAMLEDTFGLDKSFTSTDYSAGSAAALGNYMANCIIQFGLQDGSNEQFSYGNAYYSPINDPLLPELPGNPDITNPNRWQPLSLDFFIDQGGNPFPFNVPPFLSPEWGNVTPFALTNEDLEVVSRDGDDWRMFHNPGPPPQIDLNNIDADSEEYKWGFRLVSLWSAHLDPADTTMIDISPNSFGNLDINTYPQTFPEYRTFYDSIDGGDNSPGRTMNPATSLPYDTNYVKRSDYTRVLAEFWADGPDSETPPGHWFTLLNYVTDHPDFIRKYQGQGPIISALEWDVKAYFTLAGGMHDAAIAAWGVKGYHDYLRPISAIRMMCDIGQCSVDSLPNFDPAGIHLLPGLVENVYEGDTLAGDNNENVNKIKLYSWRGPDFIEDETTDTAGVGWILAENWWPYQRPTFVTPPFAGYVSGHSTFSRAAAEIMTLLTGDEYFPGGMGEFIAPKDDFLVFEQGPSDTVVLQWATYRDASDQTSLSRIWGGIHPPADDIPGRLMGYDIGHDAFANADKYFKGQQIIYVDENATGAGNGTSWTDAYNKLTVGLTNARSSQAIKELRIAGGTYTMDGTSRFSKFNLGPDLAIRGSYTANVNNPEERNFANPTILSGEKNTPAMEDNVFNVVVADKLDQRIILDGLTIAHGYADGSGTLKKKGAGILNNGSIELIDVTIEDCFGEEEGSHVLNRPGAEMKVTNVQVKN